MKQVTGLRWVIVVLTLVTALLLGGVVGAQGVGEIAPLEPPSLDGQWVAGFILVVLLLLIEYVPGFSAWWEYFDFKRTAIASAGLLTVVGLVGLHYAGAFDLSIGPFTWAVVGAAFNTWLAYLGGAWLIWSFLDSAGAIPRTAPVMDLDHLLKAEDASPER